ncbi:MAG TPA: NAD(P)-dependent oxidoreductase [Chitinophagales bacterium]|nr:NAD(P)-dependent oxidoreductase [Chitinophagales bacterium]HNE45759.1 NAD(P)-dependent oxidoreductase [Chitinophagales bacterium]HNF69010.1 NAD(P)-dependent oxidoreductase [Chitinophagales bacterium]HNK97279.1 NAD(P)-dependent oxidoreductase [Chitinophagales bacterium]
MQQFKVGIIREAKFPPDARVPLIPAQVQQLRQQFPNIEIVVQPSKGRCYADYEYTDLDVTLQEDLHDCDILFGVKEVPYDLLIPGKTYFFFSHTIKKQPHNKKLLQVLMQKNVRMIDYECLKNTEGNRVIAFGRWAGIIGAHNAIWTYAQRLGEQHLKRARDCRDYYELKYQYRGLTMPVIKMIVTGTGRVGKGAIEFLRKIGVREVTKEALLNETFSEAVFCVLDSDDLYSRKSDGKYDRNEFHSHPELYHCTFSPYTKVCDVLINCIFWNPAAPSLFHKNEMDATDWKIKVIADVSCDVKGGIPATIRSTTINEPVFGYDVATDMEIAPYIPESIDIMAIDNLPNELPRSASEEFGQQLISTVWNELFQDNSRMLDEATICKNGNLNKHFEYLRDYVTGES